MPTRLTTKAVATLAIGTLAISLTAAVVNRPIPEPPRNISAEDRALLEDLERRSVLYFWVESDPVTGLVLDRAQRRRRPRQRSQPRYRQHWPPPVSGSPPSASAPNTAGSRASRRGRSRPRHARVFRRTKRIRNTAGSITGWTCPPATASGTARPPPSIPRFCWRACSRPRNISPPTRDPETRQTKSTTAWTFPGCWMAIRSCSRTAGYRKRLLQIQVGHLLRTGACSTFWPSARPRILFPAESWYAWQRPLLRLRKVRVHQRRSAVHAPVFAGLDRFPESARPRLRRFLPELGERHARQCTVLPQSGHLSQHLRARTFGGSPLPTVPRAIGSTERSKPSSQWMAPSRLAQRADR